MMKIYYDMDMGSEAQTQRRHRGEGGDKNREEEREETRGRERQRQVCQHQDVSVVTPPALCTWAPCPTEILDHFKVLNWRTHHRHKHIRTHKHRHISMHARAIRARGCKHTVKGEESRSSLK